MNVEKIGCRLFQVREALGMTASQVVRAGAKIPMKRIYRIEDGLMRTNIIDMMELCGVYDISIDSVVFDSDDEFRELINDLKGVMIK